MILSASSVKLRSYAAWRSSLLCLIMYVGFASTDECSADTGEERRIRGKSMIQIMPLPLETLNIKQQTQAICGNVENSLGYNAPLTSAGFQQVQAVCCTPAMATFIDRLVQQDGNSVSNQGALMGLAVWYDCPSDGSDFTSLKKEVGPGHSAQDDADCAWICKAQQTCPVMKPSCSLYAGTSPSPSGSNPSPPPTQTFPCAETTTTTETTSTTA